MARDTVVALNQAVVKGNLYQAGGIAYPQFTHDVLPVDTDRLVADKQGFRDLFIAECLGNQLKDLKLSFGKAVLFDETVIRQVSGVPGSGLGPGDAIGKADAFGNISIAGSDLPDAGEQRLYPPVLQYITINAGLKGAAHDLGGFVHRQSKSKDINAGMMNELQYFQAVFFRHVQVEDQQVGRFVFQKGDELAAVGGFPNDVELHVPGISAQDVF